MPYIKKEFIDRLVDDAKIFDVIKLYENLEKKGSNYFCKSPLTDERSASMCVSPSKERFTDYSAGKSGNVITYLMEYRNLGYIEAVEFLASTMHREVAYEKLTPEREKVVKEKKLKKEELLRVAASASKKYKEALQKEIKDPKSAASVELKRRQYDEKTIADWQIGYAPGNRYIFDLCKENGVLKPAQELSLINDKTDKLWQRLIYPIHDRRDKLVGFVSRDLSGSDKTAKWMNPADSSLYDKSKIWYGLNRAGRIITRKKKAWIVEGYNDVISLHVKGMENVVASCGTAIHDNQIEELKRYTNHVVLCMDGDAAGTSSMLKYLPVFYKKGFAVDVCLLPPNKDPDDFARAYHGQDIEDELMEFCENGFSWIMKLKVAGSPVARADGANEIAKIISTLPDQGLKDIYIGMLAKESKINKSTINGIVKDLEAKALDKQKSKSENGEIDFYIWPLGVDKTQAKALSSVIQKYGLFIANNRIYKLNQDGYTFRYISNFEIEIIQHMTDDKFPKKLVRIKNVKNKEKVFDTESQNFNSLLSFKNAVTGQGNYQFYGNNEELNDLNRYLFDEMGVGRKIDILGWQPDAQVWVWNNGVTDPEEGDTTLDENGVFTKNDTTYYVPSANSIYKNDSWKFQSQKRFKVVQGDVSFTNYLTSLKDVHREHAISASLFTLSAMFRDIIVSKTNSFPLLFLYGPAASGKSQLTLGCQSFFGNPQAQINLGQNMSTGKGLIRDFAQFCNSITVLNEYKTGTPGLDDLLKGLYDGQGYKRGNLESKVSNEEVPITSAAIVTGNYYPSNDIVISRMISEEMIKDSFNSKERQAFENLEDIMKRGVSHLTPEILKHRSVFADSFTKQLRLSKDYLSGIDKIKGLKERYYQNVSVLAATYDIMSQKMMFPFSKMEMLKHFETILINQKKRVQESSTVTRFWDIFLVAIRGSEHSKLKAKIDYKLEGHRLFFNYTAVYNRIQPEWYMRYQEACPAKMQLRKDLKDSAAYDDYVTSTPMDSGRGAKNTSADVFDLKKLDQCDDIMYAIEIQMNPTRNEGPFSSGKVIDKPYDGAQHNLPI